MCAYNRSQKNTKNVKRGHWRHIHFFNKLETTSKSFLAAYYQKFNSLLSTKVQFDNEKSLNIEKKIKFFQKVM